MTEIRHALSPADREAMMALRLRLAANPITVSRESFNELLERVPPPDSVDFSDTSAGGVPGVWCVPKSHSSQAALLYLHGGVFAFGSARAYRHLAGHIAARCGVPAFVADYRLAPEHPFPAAHDDARSAYRALVAQFGPQRVALVGDSAGGGLALSLLREEPDARCGVLLSPWTDLALTGHSLDTKAEADPFLSRPALDAAVSQYLGNHPRRDPHVSPVFADAHSKPPIQVHVGTSEVLLDDALRLGRADGVDVHVWEDMPHVFPSSIAFFQAARAALDLVGAFLRTHLTPERNPS